MRTGLLRREERMGPRAQKPGKKGPVFLPLGRSRWGSGEVAGGKGGLGPVWMGWGGDQEWGSPRPACTELSSGVAETLRLQLLEEVSHL